MNWSYKDKYIYNHSDLPNNCTHFIYELSYTDGTKYIGSKCVRTIKELTPLLNGNKRDNHLAYKGRIKNNKRVSVEIVLVDKPFVKYIGSSEENKGKELIKKEILYFTSNKRTSTYLEVRELMTRKAIEPNSIYNNKNINGLWFDNCLEGLIK